jgi:hypothetical protein
MGRIAAPRVNEQTLTDFSEAIDRQCRLVGEQPYYDEWRRVIAEGAKSVAALLVDETQHGRYMRSVMPWRAFVTKEERDKIFHRDQVPPDQRWHVA